MTPAVEAEYGVVDPLAVLGHSSVNSRKLGISTSLPPGHHAVNTALTDQRTARVPLKTREVRLCLGPQWLQRFPNALS